MRSNHRRGAGLLFAVSLPLALLTGCGGGEPSAEAQLCGSVDELQVASSQFENLNLNSSRAQVEDTVDGFIVALNNVGENLGAVVESDIGAIQNSIDSVSAELENLPSSASLGEAVASIQQALVALQAALDQGLSSVGVDCDGTALGRTGS
ncbi:MAG: hypothetical protein ACRDO0_06350 [Nocardioidaceae bacterium]